MLKRPGFTLLEMVVSIGIFSVVMLGITSSFLGMRKAQGAAITTNLLKAGGEATMKRIYEDLVQAKRLLVPISTSAGAATPSGPVGTATDVGTKYFNRFDLVTDANTLLEPNTRFPKIRPSGGLGLNGTGVGELDSASIGNVLAFVREAEDVIVTTEQFNIGFISVSEKTFKMKAFRFVCYYLANVVNKPNDPPVAGRNYRLQLMRWESAPYLEKNQFDGELRRAGLSAGKLAEYTVAKGYVKTWDSGSSGPATAFYSINDSPLDPDDFLQFQTQDPGNDSAVPPTPRITLAHTDLPARLHGRQRWAVDYRLDGTAFPMVAFNSATVAVPNLPVPAFLIPDATNAPYPFGFEVAIAGSSSGRQVLVRLALAAKLNGANSWVGVPFQQVARVSDL